MIKNNKNILLITNDTTIIESISETFLELEIHIFHEENKYNLENYLLIILDDLRISSFILNQLLKLNNILNISNIYYNSFIHIKRPFAINNLMCLIQSSLNKENHILRFSNLEIINNSINIENKTVTFTNKEMRIIQLLVENKKMSKSSLLQKVWGYNNEIQTKVLENIINKIRQKFKEIGKDEIICLVDNEYKIET